MGVPGEAVEQRRELKRRRIAASVTLAAVALIVYLYMPLPPPRAAAPTARDCVELHMWSNGFHTDIGAPAEIFPDDHPLRRMFPEARSFLIGWGEQAFYYSDGTNLWLGVDALIPPSPSVLHVAYNAPASSAYLGPEDHTAVAVSREGAARFVAYIDRALVLDETGAPIVTSPGKVVGRSAFMRTRGSFHLFNVCNQWMARALRAAGVDVNARAAWLAGPLVAQVRRTGRTECPAGVVQASESGHIARE
jgi:uncharacterized protein (TIGR02117 family)